MVTATSPWPMPWLVSMGEVRAERSRRRARRRHSRLVVGMSGETDYRFSVWQGRRVRLRRFEAADWETYVVWDRDSEQARHLDAIPYPRSAAATRKWAEQEAERPPDGDNIRFVIENETGEVAGDVTTHHCDPRSGTFAYGISIRRD